MLVNVNSQVPHYITSLKRLTIIEVSECRGRTLVGYTSQSLLCNGVNFTVVQPVVIFLTHTQKMIIEIGWERLGNALI